MAEVKVLTKTGKASGKVEVDDRVFGRADNPALLHEVVVRELASLRQGTHDTKTRGRVSGGGKKPWRQKGTGRARAGSNRSPLWKGGGTTFGPAPRDHGYRMPRKKVRAAMCVALSTALRADKLHAVAKLEVKAPKTKEFAALADGLRVERGTLFVVDALSEPLELASRNVPGVAVVEAHDLTPYDVVAARRLVFTKAALALYGGAGDEA